MKLTELNWQNCKWKYLLDLNQFVPKIYTAEEIIEVYLCRIGADKNCKNTHKWALK